MKRLADSVTEQNVQVVPRDFWSQNGWTSQMQTYTYEKAMAQETRNGGASTFGNNNNGVDNSKKKLLVALDVLCLLLGK